VADASYPDHTWRLAFAYDGDKVDLVRAERIEMIAPPVVTPPPEANAGGFWLEVRDKQGNLIYHRPLYNPLRRHVEHFGDKADGAQFSVHGAPVTPTAAEPNPSRRSTAIAGARDTTLVRHSFDELRSFPK
jgi:hypothetical protein